VCPAVTRLLAALDFLDPKKMLERFGDWATVALWVIVFAESGLLIGFFLPGDSLLFVAGFLASTEGAPLNIIAVSLGCFVAAVVGDQVGYMFGKKVGPALFKRPNSRLFKQEYVERTHQFFEKNGPKTIVLARFVPVVRTFAPVVAGVGTMPYRTFVKYNVVGGLLWAVGITQLGYWLGDTIGEDNIDKYLLPIIFVIVLLSLIPPLLEYRKHKRDSAAPLDDTAAAAEAAELREILDGD
jgi:membrane-associated protein